MLTKNIYRSPTADSGGNGRQKSEVSCGYPKFDPYSETIISIAGLNAAGFSNGQKLAKTLNDLCNAALFECEKKAKDAATPILDLEIELENKKTLHVSRRLVFPPFC
jgi:hypothetical protein